MFSRKLFVFWFLSFFIPIILTGCGGGGEVALLAAIHNSGGSNNNANTGSNPKLGSVVIEQKNLTTAKVSWQAATDDLTPPEQMMYEVHLSQQTDFTPDNSTRRTTVSGVTTTELSELEVGKTYYVLVIAIDKNGLQSQEREYKAVMLSTQASNPQFLGVSFSAPSDMDKITIAWQAAVDDSTPVNLIKYEIHLSQQADFEPSEKTLNSSVTGKTQQVINGLSANTTYYVLVIAVDQDGNRSQEKQYHSVTTLSEPIIVNPNVSFSTDEELGLGNATQNGTQYTFSKFTSKLPTVGSFLFIHSGDEVHLRKVESANVVAGALVIQTGDAALADILDQVTITSKSSFYDTDTPDNVLRAQSKSTQGVLHSIRPPGLLTKQSSTPNDKPSDISFTLDPPCVSYKSDFIKACWYLNLKPILDSDFAIKKNKLTRGYVNLSGTLNGNIKISIDANNGQVISKPIEITIFEKKYTRLYFLGGIPMAQVETFSLKMALTAHAIATFKTEMTVNLQGTASIGVRFNPVTQTWENIPSSPKIEGWLTKPFLDELKDKFTVDGDAEAEIRLIPNYSIKFYGLAGPEMSIEPSVKFALNIDKAEALSKIGKPPFQVSQFDVTSTVDWKAGIAFDALDKFPKYSDTLLSKSWKLLSLPKLSVTTGEAIVAAASQGDQPIVRVNQPFYSYGKWTDGANNKFLGTSVLWYVDPDTSISETTQYTKIIPSSEGVYTVFYSGTGELTKNIRQYVWIETKISPEEIQTEKPVPSERTGEVIPGCSQKEGC